MSILLSLMPLASLLADPAPDPDRPKLSDLAAQKINDAKISPYVFLSSTLKIGEVSMKTPIEWNIGVSAIQQIQDIGLPNKPFLVSSYDLRLSVESGGKVEDSDWDSGVFVSVLNSLLKLDPAMFQLPDYSGKYINSNITIFSFYNSETNKKVYGIETKEFTINLTEDQFKSLANLAGKAHAEIEEQKSAK